MVDRTNHAVAVHEEAGRQRESMIDLAHLPVRVEQRRKGELMFAHERRHRAGIFLEIHGQHREALIVVLQIGCLDGRHLDAARWAPGCPDVDQQHLSLEIAQRDVRTVQVGERKVGRRMIGQRCGPQYDVSDGCWRRGGLLRPYTGCHNEQTSQDEHSDEEPLPLAVR